MVTHGNQHTLPKRSPQGSEGPIAEANKIGASTPCDFEGKNLTAYGGLLRVATMLEKSGFQPRLRAIAVGPKGYTPVLVVALRF
jgi:hypothetical protein